MPVVVLLIVLVVIGFLLYKSVQDARKHPGTTAATPHESQRQRPRPRARPRTKPRQPKPKIDEAALNAHVLKLREAVDGGFISIDEAIGSIVRHTDGALGKDAARKLLETTDDAA